MTETTTEASPETTAVRRIAVSSRTEEAGESVTPEQSTVGHNLSSPGFGPRVFPPANSLVRLMRHPRPHQPLRSGELPPRSDYAAEDQSRMKTPCLGFNKIETRLRTAGPTGSAIRYLGR